MTVDEIVDKFWHNIDFSQTISRSNAEKVLDTIDRLEKLEDTGELVALLVAPTAESIS